jgi:hypothetical protein
MRLNLLDLPLDIREPLVVCKSVATFWVSLACMLMVKDLIRYYCWLLEPDEGDEVVPPGLCEFCAGPATGAPFELEPAVPPPQAETMSARIKMHAILKNWGDIHWRCRMAENIGVLLWGN